MGTQKKLPKEINLLTRLLLKPDCFILGMKKNASINNESYMYNELQNYMQTSR